jgi:hypothetical protein
MTCSLPLIEAAPSNTDECIAWLGTLPNTQFERVWCTLIAERLEDVSMRETMRMLVYVRERYRMMYKGKPSPIVRKRLACMGAALMRDPFVHVRGKRK